MSDYAEDDMQLPHGKTCADCYHFRRCNLIFGHVETDTYCDWSPSRYHEASPQQRVEGGVVKPLSPGMLHALSKVNAVWRSAYELGVSRQMLNALWNRELVERRYEIGAMAFPRTGIEYRLKAKS